MLNNTSDENNVTPHDNQYTDSDIDYSTMSPAMDGFTDIPHENEALDSEIKQCWKQALNNHITEFNRKFSVVLFGDKTRIMKTVYNDELMRLQRSYLHESSLHSIYSNRRIKVGVKTLKNGEVDIEKTWSQAWMSNPMRKTYEDGITFHPSIYIKGFEVKAKISREVFNLWQGYSVPPIKGASGALDLLHYHIREIVCDGNIECYEYLLNWFARGFQTPALTGQVAVALKGEKGCGKGTLGNFIKKLYGQHGVQVTNTKHLVGNFNGHLVDCCFLFADEAIFAGDKQNENTLKGLITESEIMIERKGVDAVSATNRLKIFMASNNDWIVPASSDERRYFVLNVSSSKLTDKEYYTRLRHVCESPVIQSAFLYEMLHRDISTFQVSKVPDTKALQQQRAQSLDSFQHYWFDVLQRGFIYQTEYNNVELNNWQGRPPIDLVRNGYEQWCNKGKLNQYAMVSREKMGKHMTNWYLKNRGTVELIIGEAKDGKPAMSIKRPWCYLLGTHKDAIVAFCEFEKLDTTDLLKNCE